jgi:hypothetical protein
MATYASYTQNQKDIVDNTAEEIRGAAISLLKIWELVERIAGDANAVALMTGLDVGEILANRKGRAGAADLTRTEVVNLYNLLNGIRTTNDTAANRNLITKATGITSLL